MLKLNKNLTPSRWNQMKRCQGGTTTTERKCRRVVTDEYCWEHKPPLSNVLTYFSILPNDLLRLLVLKMPSPQFLSVLRRLKHISHFANIIKDEQLWKMIWHRDISSFMPLPKYADYINSFDELYNCTKKMNTSNIRDRSLDYVLNRQTSMGHICRIVEYLTKRGMDILLYTFLAQFSDDSRLYNVVTDTASKYGHIQIVKTLSEKTSIDNESAMEVAAKYGHIEIVKLMLERGADNFNQVMEAAAENGHIEIVRLMLANSADSFDIATEGATENGHIEIVKLMLEKGVTDFNRIMENAAENGHIEIVKLMLEKGADKYEWAMDSARDNNHKHVMKLLKSYM